MRREDPIAAIGVYWASPHKATDDEVARLQALADTAALALSNLASIERETAARAAAEAAADRAAFLAHASRVVASSLDHETALKNLTQLLVPDLADWCVVCLARKDGTLRRIGPDYHDPDLMQLAAEFDRVAPRLDLAAQNNPIVAAIRTGQSVLMSQLPSAARKLGCRRSRPSGSSASFAIRTTSTWFDGSRRSHS